MAELFLNPWSMAAGGLLVSAPILIHLINRMRFKRVRWAAMEFLLKAQKRMKRKLILQQLILLLLRCLLVFLLGLLFGRFLGFSPLDGDESRTTTHVVLLDDSPSMGDVWRGDDGQMTDSFGQAKRLLADQIVPAAAQATGPQTLEVVRLSDLANPRPIGRINAGTPREVENYLGGYKPSAVRVGLVDGLRKAKEILAGPAAANTAQVVHVLSDFRSPDWAEDGETIKQLVGKLTAAKVKVHLVDVAHPFRKDDNRPPLFHDNVGIVELRPAKLTTARYEPLEFYLRVRNFGAVELKDVLVTVFVNGDENRGGKTVTVPTLPPNDERTIRFELSLDRVATPDRPLDRFSLVTAALKTPEPGGVAADNSRHALVEVRDRLPVLVIDGSPPGRDGEEKKRDGFYLRRIFTDVLGGFAWVNGTVRDLEQPDLRKYSGIYLLSVPALTEPQAKNLEAYAADGGGVAFFLGEGVKPKDYNDLLHRKGAGLFPVPLPERSTDPLSPEKRLERSLSLERKILTRDRAAKGHPALANIYYDDFGNRSKDEYDFEKFFSFVVIDRYWPVRRFGGWVEDKSVTELYCMPNDQPMGTYEPEVQQLSAALPIDQPKFARYKEVIDKLRADLRRTAATNDPLYRLALLLDRLLSDQRNEGDPTEALIREFWAHPELADVKAQAARLRDRVKYGDPLYLARQFGRGRVAVLLTTAGEAWNDWSSGQGKASFLPVVKEMQLYLSGGGAEENRSVGEPVRMTLDETRYRPTFRRAFVGFDPGKTAPPGANPDPAPVVDLKDQTMEAKDKTLNLLFAENAAPGGYLFTLTQLREQAAAKEAAEVPEYLGFAFNVDARREGELKRVGRDDLTQLAPGAPLHSPLDAGWLDELKNKKTDLSESGWLFLLLLAVLVAEQYMAVRLSFHTRAGEGGNAPSAAALFNRPTSRPQTADDEAPAPTAA